jgi:hypothetical protein
MWGKFRLDTSLKSSVAGFIPGAVVNSRPLQSEFQATSQLPIFIRGDYYRDLALGKYSLSWSSMEEMMSWLKEEEEIQVIELQLKEKRINDVKEKAWTVKFYYVCARQGTGGEKKYKKNHPKWGRKVPSKWCTCECHLTIKAYPNTFKILGQYHATHSHPIGDRNAQFTKLPEETRIQTAEMLCMGITHDRIVCCRLINLSCSI